MTADSKPIESLDLSVCAYSCLKRHGINTVGDLVKLGDEGLSRVENLSQTRIAEIKEKLSGYASEEMVPVVHAHWTDFSAQKVLNMENCEEQYKVLGYPHRTLLGLRCSRCRMVTFADSSIRYGYCPHCGAKMDEVSE